MEKAWAYDNNLKEIHLYKRQDEDYWSSQGFLLIRRVSAMASLFQKQITGICLDPRCRDSNHLYLLYFG